MSLSIDNMILFDIFYISYALNFYVFTFENLYGGVVIMVVYERCVDSHMYLRMYYHHRRRACLKVYVCFVRMFVL